MSKDPFLPVVWLRAQLSYALALLRIQTVFIYEAANST
jgi:hypothetical protein